MTAATVERTGRAALAAVVLLGLAATLALAVSAPPALVLAVPAVLVAGAVGLATLGRPSSGLAATLVLSVGLLGYGEKSSLGSLVFAAYFLAFLVLWFGGRLLSGEPVVRSRTDAVMVLFVFGGLAGGTVLGVVMGADPTMLLGEVRSFVMLVLYFPIREAVRSERNGPLTVVACLTAIGLASAAWNGYTLWSTFNNASELWQIIDVRTAYGEATLAVSFLLSVGLLASVRERRAQLGVAVVVSVLFVGLVLTKSRGYWIAALLGGAVMVALLPRAERVRVSKLGAGVLVGVAVLGTVFLGQYLQLLVTGIAKRFLTLGSAATGDVSLINRFFETAAAWALIQQNPVAGYGFGVPFSRYDIIEKGTVDWSFIHNGYVGMWYKLGLWGLVLMLTAWISCAVLAAQAARSTALRTSDRIVAAASAGALLTLAIAVVTSNPFLLADQTLVVTVVLGLASGLGQRARA